MESESHRRWRLAWNTAAPTKTFDQLLYLARSFHLSHGRCGVRKLVLPAQKSNLGQSTAEDYLVPRTMPAKANPVNMRLPKRRSWASFYHQQLQHIAKSIYRFRAPVVPAEAPARPVTVICISDTHNLQLDLPEGDLLLHAGDLTQKGSFQELQDQIDWLDRQPHLHKVVVAGKIESIHIVPSRVFIENSVEETMIIYWIQPLLTTFPNASSSAPAAAAPTCNGILWSIYKTKRTSSNFPTAVS